MTLSVAMITMNEELAIAKVVGDIRRAAPDAEIVVHERIVMENFDGARSVERVVDRAAFFGGDREQRFLGAHSASCRRRPDE